MWPRNRSADVLLQGGVRAVMPYLKDIAQRRSLPSALRAEQAAARSIASRILRAWKRELADASGLMDGEEPSRPDMITVPRTAGYCASRGVRKRHRGANIRRQRKRGAGRQRGLARRPGGRASCSPTWRGLTCRRAVENIWICFRAWSTERVAHQARHGGADYGTCRGNDRALPKRHKRTAASDLDDDLPQTDGKRPKSQRDGRGNGGHASRQPCGHSCTGPAPRRVRCHRKRPHL